MDVENNFVGTNVKVYEGDTTKPREISVFILSLIAKVMTYFGYAGAWSMALKEDGCFLIRWWD